MARRSIPQPTGPFVWGGYPRISDDPDDRQAGVDRQITDIKIGVQKAGGDPETIRWFTENNTSAYRKKRVRVTDEVGNEYFVWRVIRPKMQAALAALRAGEIHGLMVYDLDRLARDPRDLEDVIELVTYYGARVQGIVPGQIKLTDSDGITMARLFVVMAAKSSADTGRRVARAHEEFAIQGKPVGGTRPFGWKDDKRTLNEVEANLVREAVKQLMDGASLTSIARGWNDAGVKTSRGGQWQSSSVKQYMSNPRLSGWRTIHGEIAVDRQGQQVVGQWTPILDQLTFERLQVAMSRHDNRRVKSRRGARRYLLSGLLTCGVCLRPMYGAANGSPDPDGETGRRWSYACNTRTIATTGAHRNSAPGPDVNRIVEAQMLLRMQSQVLEPVAVEFDGQMRLNEIEEELRDGLTELRAGGASKTLFTYIRTLEDEQAELEKARNLWVADTAEPAPEAVDLATWDSFLDDQKRPRIERALERIILLPADSRPNRWTGFDAERLVYDWRELNSAGEPSQRARQG